MLLLPADVQGQLQLLAKLIVISVWQFIGKNQNAARRAQKPPTAGLWQFTYIVKEFGKAAAIARLPTPVNCSKPERERLISGYSD